MSLRVVIIGSDNKSDNGEPGQGPGADPLSPFMADVEQRDVVYVPMALSFVPLTSPMRRWALMMHASPLFNAIMMSVIVANAIFLALYDPVNVNSPLNAQLITAEFVFLVLFTIEMCIRILALGLFWEGRSTYLRNSWYVLDFVIVVFGWAAVGIDQPQTATFSSAARLIRLLRLIRVLRFIPGISWMTSAVSRSAPQLTSALLLLFYFLLVTCVIGMCFFRGALWRRCVSDFDGQVLQNDTVLHRYCADDQAWMGRQCPDNSTCTLMDEPPLAVSYDNFLLAFVAVFSVITLEDWTMVMYGLFDVYGEIVFLYFFFVSCAGAYVVLNTFVAVLAINVGIERSFAAAMSNLSPQQKAMEQELRRHRALLGTMNESTDLYRRRRLALYLKRHKIKRRSSVEMRIMLSFERMGKVPEYQICTQQRYEELKVKHGAYYAKWKELIVPILDFNERLAAGSRRREARELWMEGENQSKPFTDSPDPLITPAFVINEIRLLDESMHIRHRAEGRNLFARADSALTKMFRFPKWARESPAGVRADAHWVRKRAFALVTSPYFEWFMQGCVILSTLVLACAFYGQPLWMDTLIYATNVIFVATFVLEALIKLMGLGHRVYFSDAANIFDFCVALAGVIELVVQSYVQALALALRAIRIMRVFRLARFWEGSRHISAVVLSSWSAVLPFSALLLLFNFLVSLMGLQFFGGTLEVDNATMVVDGRVYDCTESYVNYPHCPPRMNFDTFLWAFVNSFQVIVASNWPTGMLLAVHGTNWAAALFFIVVVAFGQLILMNLLLGVLIDVFLKGSDEVADAQKLTVDPLADSKAAEEKLRHFLERKRMELMRITFDEHPSRMVRTLGGLLDHQHPIRTACGTLAMSVWFDAFITATIIASCAALVADSPLASPDTLGALNICNIVFVAVFVFEMVVKIIAFGTWGHAGAYFESAWNVFNALLVIMGVISIILSSVGQLQTARVFWALRPLRLLSRVEGMQVVLRAVVRASRPISQVGFLLLLMYIVASVLAVELWGGKVAGCYVVNATDALFNPLRNFTEGVCRPDDLRGIECDPEYLCPGNNWLDPTYVGGGASFSFDSVPQAALVLFEMSTLENWNTPMYDMVDAVGVNLNPVRDNSQYISLLAIVFILLFNMLMLQIFIAVVVHAFQATESEHQGRTFLTARQYEWVELQRLAASLKFRAKIIPPPDEPRRSVHRLVTSSMFKRAVGVAILLYTMLMCSKHTRESDAYQYFYLVASSLLGAFYIAEALLKIIAFNLRHYLARRDNVMDLAVCLCVVLKWAVPAWQEWLDAIIVLRVGKLLYWSPATSHMLYNLKLSLPTLANVVLVLFCLYFIYGAIGVAVFGTLVHEIDEVNFAALTVDYVNFDHFGHALIVLFRLSTGDGWDAIMNDLALGYPVFAYLYCLSFVVLVDLFVINLVVAAIIREMEADTIARAKGLSSKVTLAALQSFGSVWADVRFDYDESQAIDHLKRDDTKAPSVAQITRNLVRDSEHNEKAYLPATELPSLILKLPPPLGLAHQVGITRGHVMRVIRELDLPVDDNGRIELRSTLKMLINHIVLNDSINKVLAESLGRGRQSNGGGVAQAISEELKDLLEIRAKAKVDVHDRRSGARESATERIAMDLVRQQVRRYLKRKARQAGRSLRSLSPAVSAKVLPDHAPSISENDGVDVGNKRGNNGKSENKTSYDQESSAVVPVSLLDDNDDDQVKPPKLE